MPVEEPAIHDPSNAKPGDGRARRAAERVPSF